MGPDLADMRILWIKMGPLQAVRVEPGQAVLASQPRAPSDLRSWGAERTSIGAFEPGEELRIAEQTVRRRQLGSRRRR